MGFRFWRRVKIALGHAKRARSDLEKMYASDPPFEDMETRLST